MSDSAYDNRAPGDTRLGNWMQTHSGRRFWPLDPRPEEILIEDIAAALSKLTRYNGHSLRFYSVAEHSVLVSHCVPRFHAFTALLHDATEAYLGDVIRPLKRYLSGYTEIEERVWIAVAQRFGLPVMLPPCVKDADNAVLLAERDQILAPTPEDWAVPGEPAAVEIKCWSPDVASARFMARFYELGGEL